jgi:hypothetical protein
MAHKQRSAGLDRVGVTGAALSLANGGVDCGGQALSAGTLLSEKGSRHCGSETARNHRVQFASPSKAVWATLGMGRCQRKIIGIVHLRDEFHLAPLVFTSTAIWVKSFAQQRYCRKFGTCKLCCIFLQVAPKQISVKSFSLQYNRPFYTCDEEGLRRALLSRPFEGIFRGCDEPVAS